MTIALILNIAFSTMVLAGIVGLLAHSVVTEHRQHTGAATPASARVRPAGAPALGQPAIA
jgi:hypothetical protein